LHRYANRRAAFGEFRPSVRTLAREICPAARADRIELPYLFIRSDIDVVALFSPYSSRLEHFKAPILKDFWEWPDAGKTPARGRCAATGTGDGRA
jgi:hypothetical protein